MGGAADEQRHPVGMDPSRMAGTERRRLAEHETRAPRRRKRHEVAATASWARCSDGLSPGAYLLQMRWTFLVDAALAPIGLLTRGSGGAHPAAVALVLPLVGLLAFFAREREVRIDHALELSHAYRGTALLLGDMIEADDAYTGATAATWSTSSLAVA